MAGKSSYRIGPANMRGIKVMAFLEMQWNEFYGMQKILTQRGCEPAYTFHMSHLRSIVVQIASKGSQVPRR